MKTIKNVARGVNLLDEKLPGWENQVKLDKLNLGSSCNCVCGQIVTKKGRYFSRFEAGLHVLGLFDGSPAAKHGFVAWGNQSYDKLTDEWTKVIRAKRRGEEITS